MKKRVNEILHLATGTNPPESFGVPLSIIFMQQFTENSEEECKAAAIIALLYISCRRKGFPIEKLRSCIYNIDEQTEKIYFNCNHYDKIIESIPEYMFHNIPLYNKECSIEYVTLTKEDISVALDFYTNR